MTCVGLSRLSREELAKTFDWPRVQQIAAYPGRVQLFGNTFWTSNDGGSECAANPSFVPWLADVTGDAFLAHWHGNLTDDFIRNFSLLVRAFDGLARRPDLLEIAPVEKPRGFSAVLLDDQKAAIVRQPTAAGDLTVCLTGGHNAEPHNHNDLGHVTVCLGTEIVLPDLGQPRYKPSFFGPARYTWLAASSRGHSCPIINGCEQIAGRDAASRVLAWDAAEGRLLLDCTAAYPPEAKLQQWTRQIQRTAGGTITLTDQFTAEPGTPITHVLWSRFHPVQPGDGLLRIGKLRVRCSVAMTQTTRVSGVEHDMVDPLNHSLHRLEFETRASADGQASVTTIFSAE